MSAALELPVFVKPANLGSSVGISKAVDPPTLEAGIALARRFDRKIVVEAAVPAAREIECAVLGNDVPEASVLSEIIPSGEFYDYASKYLDDASTEVIPADLALGVTAGIRQMAIEAFRAIDGSGMARVDFLVDGDSGTVYLNELNTIPGFTAISQYAKLWAASGLAYPALLDRLIALALERPRGKATPFDVTLDGAASRTLAGTRGGPAPRRAGEARRACLRNSRRGCDTNRMLGTPTETLRKTDKFSRGVENIFDKQCVSCLTQ